MTSGNLKIKVCGMRDPDNIRRLVELNPDYIGFILYPRSKRYLGNNYSLSVEIPLTIKRIGVFVNALIPEVVGWVNKLNLDYVQLHGFESPEYCMELANMNIHILKSFSIESACDFSVIENYMPWCDYVLFDNKTPFYGGSGEQFDWTVLQEYKFSKPFFLSGGIGPSDSKSVKKLKNPAPYAIDINSKFETAAGLKDILLIQEFITKIRSE
jgi:phosphoribosylanthranilate isomerase